MPFVVLMAGWAERNLACKGSERRPWQALHKAFALVARPVLEYCQQVDRRAKAKFDLVAARGLNELRGHAWPNRGTTPNGVNGTNTDQVFRRMRRLRARRL